MPYPYRYLGSSKRLAQQGSPRKAFQPPRAYGLANLQLPSVTPRKRGIEVGSGSFVGPQGLSGSSGSRAVKPLPRTIDRDTGERGGIIMGALTFWIWDVQRLRPR